MQLRISLKFHCLRATGLLLNYTACYCGILTICQKLTISTSFSHTHTHTHTPPHPPPFSAFTQTLSDAGHRLASWLPYPLLSAGILLTESLMHEKTLFVKQTPAVRTWVLCPCRHTMPLPSMMCRYVHIQTLSYSYPLSTYTCLYHLLFLFYRCTQHV